MGFDKFKEVFDGHYKDGIYSFIEEATEGYVTEDSPCPFKFKEEDDLDDISHDSYGNENSDLRRIYYISDFDIYVEFWGNRSSYQGEDWYGYKEVLKKEKTISVWEQKN